MESEILKYIYSNVKKTILMDKFNAECARSVH